MPVIPRRRVTRFSLTPSTRKAPLMSLLIVPTLPDSPADLNALLRRLASESLTESDLAALTTPQPVDEAPRKVLLHA